MINYNKLFDEAYFQSIEVLLVMDTEKSVKILSKFIKFKIYKVKSGTKVLIGLFLKNGKLMMHI